MPVTAAVYLCAVNTIARFLLLYVVFLLVVGGIFFGYNQLADPRFTHKYGWVAFGMFAAVTGLIHTFLLRAAQKDPKAFIRGFLAATTLKLFIYLGFLVIFILFQREKAAVFISEFAAFYFIFTVFEVTLLYGSVRPKK